MSNTYVQMTVTDCSWVCFMRFAERKRWTTKELSFVSTASCVILKKVASNIICFRFPASVLFMECVLVGVGVLFVFLKKITEISKLRDVEQIVDEVDSMFYCS